MKLALSRETFIRQCVFRRPATNSRTKEDACDVRGRFWDYCASLEAPPTRTDLARRFGISVNVACRWCKDLGVPKVDFDEIRYARAVAFLEGRTEPVARTEFARTVGKKNGEQGIEQTLALLKTRRPDLRALVVNVHELTSEKVRAQIDEIRENCLTAREVEARFGISYVAAQRLCAEASDNHDVTVDEAWRRETLDNPEPWDAEYEQEITRMKYDGFRYAGDVWRRYRALWDKKRLQSVEIKHDENL